MIPDLARIFDRVDAIKDELRNAKIRINALELIHGESIRDAANADHREYLALVEELGRVTERFNVESQKVGEMGGMVKGVEPGLVDFYGVVGHHVVFLCWQRGEEEITHWHHVDTGFADRQPLETS